MRVLKFCLVLGAISLISVSRAEAGKAGGIEDQIFSALIAEGVYLHQSFSSPAPVQGAGNLYLESLMCSHHLMPNTYNCTLKDTARPFERKTITGENAKVIFENLVAAGVKAIEAPFSGGQELMVFAERLQCSKSGFVVKYTEFRCQSLKPLVVE